MYLTLFYHTSAIFLLLERGSDLLSKTGIVSEKGKPKSLQRPHLNGFMSFT